MYLVLALTLTSYLARPKEHDEEGEVPALEANQRVC